MLDTELTVSLPMVVRVDIQGRDFNGLVRAIQAAAAEACGELLRQALRAVERRAMQPQPRRWVNRGQQTRRIRLSWGAVAVRRTRVRDRRTGKTYNLADRLLGWRRCVRRGMDVVRTGCELAVALPDRPARYWWQRLTGLRCNRMSFWRMVQRAGPRLVGFEQDEVGEIRSATTNWVSRPRAGVTGALHARNCAAARQLRRFA